MSILIRPVTYTLPVDYNGIYKSLQTSVYSSQTCQAKAIITLNTDGTITDSNVYTGNIELNQRDKLPSRYTSPTGTGAGNYLWAWIYRYNTSYSYGTYNIQAPVFETWIPLTSQLLFSVEALATDNQISNAYEAYLLRISSNAGATFIRSGGITLNATATGYAY